MDGYYNHGYLAELLPGSFLSNSAPWSSEQPSSHAHSEDSINDQPDDTILRLLEIRKKNTNKLTIANLNVNSIPNKFEHTL